MARDDDFEEDDFVVDDDTADDIDADDADDVDDVDDVDDIDDIDEDLVGDVDKDLDVVPLAAQVVVDDDDDIDDIDHADKKGDDDEEDEADEADHDDEEDEEEDTTDEEEQSLDVLLAREVAQDDDDLGRLDDETRGTLSVPTIPIGEGEFTCRSCFLVKRRAQLADEAKLICLDCA